MKSEKSTSEYDPRYKRLIYEIILPLYKAISGDLIYSIGKILKLL